MKIYKKSISFLLAFTTIFVAAAPAVSAAEAAVTVDEAVYVNLDYYGKTDKINIVKGCSLNGNSSVTDYGNYESVINMSNEAQPTVSDGTVQWTLPEDTGRFYYQCTPKDGDISIPWSFDVSYKLNGVPTNADKLAGASGLVEIDIKTTANDNISDYYKNNMMLMVEAAVDMDKTTSIEAPGSQLQSVGNYKAVVFAGLPGEDNEFVMRIGTKSFETTGIMMTMMPATVDQLKDIKDLSKDKDDIKDSSNAAYESLNETLNTLQQASAGLSQVQSGLNNFNNVRENVASSENTLYDSADKSIADMTPVINQMTALIPHLQSAQQEVQDVSDDVNSLVLTVNDIKPSISSMISTSGNIQKDIKKLINLLDDMEDLSDDRDNVISDLEDNIDTMDESVDSMEYATISMKTDISNLSTSLSALNTLMGSLAGGGGGTPTDVSEVPGATISALNQELAYMFSGTHLLSNTAQVMNSTGDMLDVLTEMCDQSDDFIDNINDTVSLMKSYFNLMDEGTSTAKSLMKEMNSTIDSLNKMLSTSQTLIDKTSALNDTVNSYKDGTVQTIKDTQDLFSGLTTALTDTQTLLSTMQSTLKSSRGDIDEGSRQSLTGLIDVLQKTLEGIQNTDTLRNANDTFKRVIDNQMDKLDEDSNLLNIDCEASPISFTSDKNPAPSSIQIIMRTEEITVDDKENNSNLETSKEKTGVFQRIGKIFKKIYVSISQFFS